ncbi:DUF86 domain-containing protein [bacterium]|nr:DUF86 domain-containing protein [bacterium]
MAATTKEFERALARLKQALAQPKDEFVRDSVIQRFEFTVELAWKSAKKVLGLSATAPKVVVRDLAQQGLIDDPNVWFKLIDARNLSSHSYNEQVAEEIYDIAREAVVVFDSLFERLQSL